MEVDHGFEVREVPKAAGQFLDGLDLAVESFRDGVRDAMAAVGQDVGEVPLERRSSLLDRLEATMGGPEVPPPPEPMSRCGIPVVPQPPQGLLDGPRPPNLELQAPQGVELRPTGDGDVLATVEPQVLGALERLIALRE